MLDTGYVYIYQDLFIRVNYMDLPIFDHFFNLRKASVHMVQPDR